MQTGKKSVESVKETASNIAASAKSGMEKTKATVQEKKEMAARKKDERITEAELNKREAREHNAAQKQVHTTGAGTNYAPGATGHSTGPHVGTGYPSGHVEGGTAGSDPFATGTDRLNPAHNTTTGGYSTGYGTGGYTG
ncbi:hypothetical protein Nepgr_010047 [Nepenthes gracilis]|uniref:Uncharacterized protein n=1 Tax=Nepenthes gracilis TaxID=150966 RepID=A0AAD3SCM2_NEPGR|nr:hypothetical protein Nepgr_010047 [Nepenthes gracilis]